MSPEEQILVEGCRRGDEQAWLALYRAFAADVGRYLNGMLQRPGDTDDLVQRVFLEFLSSLGRYRGDAGLRTWLHRIARNLALRQLRSRQRREKHIRAYAEAIEDTAVRPQARLEAREQLERVNALLARVDEGFREVWLLREIQGFTVADAAAILEIPAATVRTRHHRARRQLFALLEAEDEPNATVAGPELRLIRAESDE